MPYRSCPQCGLRTYCVRGDECPRCGTPLGGESGHGSDPPAWPAGGPRDDAVERVLSLARRELRMDVAVLTEVRDGREIVRWAVGNGRLGAVTPGASAPLRETICERLLDGTIDSAVPDAGADPRLRDLPAVRDAGIVGYIGVPLTGGDARRYVLCCLAAEARPDLTDADVRFLRGLVESLRPAIEQVTDGP